MRTKIESNFYIIVVPFLTSDYRGSMAKSRTDDEEDETKTSENEIESSKKPRPLSIGTKVIVDDEHHGKITRVHRNQSLAIAYQDQEKGKEKYVDMSRVRVVSLDTEEDTEPGHSDEREEEEEEEEEEAFSVAVDDIVQVLDQDHQDIRHERDKKFGQVLNVRTAKAQVDVRFISTRWNAPDVGIEKKISQSRIRPNGAAANAKSTTTTTTILQVGMSVKYYHPQEQKWFRGRSCIMRSCDSISYILYFVGTIDRVRSNKITFDINCSSRMEDNEDEDEDHERTTIHRKIPRPQIVCYFDRQRLLVLPNLHLNLKSRSEELIKVVSRSLSSASLTLAGQLKTSLQVNDRVTFKNEMLNKTQEQRWGTIVKVRSNGTYDVEHDDDEEEEQHQDHRLSKRMPRHELQFRSRAEEGEWKAKGRTVWFVEKRGHSRSSCWHKGTIVKERSNGTFDVETFKNDDDDDGPVIVKRLHAQDLRPNSCLSNLRHVPSSGWIPSFSSFTSPRGFASIITSRLDLDTIISRHATETSNRALEYGRVIHTSKEDDARVTIRWFGSRKSESDVSIRDIDFQTYPTHPFPLGTRVEMKLNCPLTRRMNRVEIGTVEYIYSSDPSQVVVQVGQNDDGDEEVEVYTHVSISCLCQVGEGASNEKSNKSKSESEDSEASDHERSDEASAFSTSGTRFWNRNHGILPTEWTLVLVGFIYQVWMEAVYGAQFIIYLDTQQQQERKDSNCVAYPKFKILQLLFIGTLLAQLATFLRLVWLLVQLVLVPGSREINVWTTSSLEKVRQLGSLIRGCRSSLFLTSVNVVLTTSLLLGLGAFLKHSNCTNDVGLKPILAFLKLKRSDWWWGPPTPYPLSWFFLSPTSDEDDPSLYVHHVVFHYLFGFILLHLLTIETPLPPLILFRNVSHRLKLATQRLVMGIGLALVLHWKSIRCLVQIFHVFVLMFLHHDEETNAFSEHDNGTLLSILMLKFIVEQWMLQVFLPCIITKSNNEKQDPRTLLFGGHLLSDIQARAERGDLGALAQQEQQEQREKSNQNHLHLPLSWTCLSLVSNVVLVMTEPRLTWTTDVLLDLSYLVVFLVRLLKYHRHTSSLEK